jgi:hypothetical protein
MSIIDVAYRTVTCNGTDCKNTITFEPKNAPEIAKENPWLKNLRIVQANGQNYTYCSDSCELTGVAAGFHNLPEEKKIVAVPNVGQATSAIQAAAAAAKQAEQANRALKTGEGGTIQIHQ